MLNSKEVTVAAVTAIVLQAGALAAAGNGNKLISAMASPSQISFDRTVDGTTFLQDMTDAAAAMKSYSFEYDTTVFKGSKVVQQQGLFYFKQPRLLRVEMTGKYKHGAVAVMGRDGKVRGHLGGALSPFTMTVSPNSDLLLGVNGYPMVDSDFAGMCSAMRRFVQQGCKVKVTDAPVNVEGQPSRVYVLEFYRGPNNSELYKRAYIDPKTLLPVEWFDYQDGKLFARTIWKNVKQDVSIADALFQL
jgi:outer membrane lipoprotein-sorting protein